MLHRTVPVSPLSGNRRRAELPPGSPAKRLVSQAGDTSVINDQAGSSPR
jgi:hypothetical protein